MIVDTSALMAILLEEPEAERFLHVLLKQGGRMPAGCWVEIAVVLTRRNLDVLFTELTVVMQRAGIEISPMSVSNARAAHDAYRTYGVGTGHPARLNFGDCFAYALAKETGDSLLFKGDDFGHTDVTPALR